MLAVLFHNSLRLDFLSYCQSFLSKAKRASLCGSIIGLQHICNLAVFFSLQKCNNPKH